MRVRYEWILGVGLLAAAQAAPARAAPQPDIRAELSDNYGSSWAVVIGIDRYRNWPWLNSAVKDADQVAARLQLLGFEHVITLRDSEATRAAIVGVWERLQRDTRADDRVLFFFAGHGQTESLPNGDSKGYLIPADASWERYAETALSVDELRALGKQVPAKHLLYVMDACYSGQMLLRAGRSGAAPAWLRKPVRQVLAAGRAGEQVIEQGGSGLFTRILLEGLDGGADLDHDGMITASEIGVYVNPRVAKLSQGAQTPQFGRMAGEGEFVLAKKSAPARPLPALAPVITPVRPRSNSVRLAIGRVQGFAVDALDPNGAQLAETVWQLDGRQVGTGLRWSFSGGAPGSHTVRFVARSREDQGAAEEWTVEVVAPDKLLPRVAIEISERLGGRDSSCGLLCGELERALLQQRATVVSQEQLARLRQRDVTLALDDREAAAAMGERLGVDILLRGSCEVGEPRRQRFEGVEFFIADEATCEVRAIEAATAYISLSERLEKPRKDTSATSADSAVTRALKATVDGRAAALAKRLIYSWSTAEPRLYEVLIRDVEGAALGGTETKLRSLEGVRRLQRRSYQQRIAELNLEYQGDQEALINGLYDLGYELIGEDPGRVTVRPRARAAGGQE
ncbi:MAG: caspase family protein [Deltaproteobacteria bacterium]|nr:caspase family protein [Deltaproteobacteria bacterium]